MMSNIEVTIVMYILVIITSIIIYATKTRILYKNKNGECPERSPKGVTCFIVDLTTYPNFNTYR